MGRLPIASLKSMLLFSPCLGFPVIQTSSALKTNIAPLVEFLENLTFLLKLALSFFDLAKPKEVLHAVHYRYLYVIRLSSSS